VSDSVAFVSADYLLVFRFTYAYVSFCRHSKCELAKMLNNEKSFREILEKKDSIIRDKDETISRLKRDMNDHNK